MFGPAETSHAFATSCSTGRGARVELRFAYNTNGTAHHRMEDAVALVADSGYDGIALTLDHVFLDPMAEGWERRTEVLARELRRRRLGCVIESGARFLLDPRDKHQPTLVSATPGDRERRLAFLRRSLDIGAMLEAEAMSFWAGSPRPEMRAEDAWDWLRAGVEQVLAHADRAGVTAAMEPEPEMMIATVDHFRQLHDLFPSLRLALDLGHVMVTQEREPQDAVREFAAVLGSVSIEDMRRGDHVHLAFGDGDMDIPACLDALEAGGFSRLVCVELSSDSGRADRMVPDARRWLAGCRG